MREHSAPPAFCRSDTTLYSTDSDSDTTHPSVPSLDSIRPLNETYVYTAKTKQNTSEYDGSNERSVPDTKYQPCCKCCRARDAPKERNLEKDRIWKKRLRIWSSRSSDRLRTRDTFSDTGGIYFSPEVAKHSCMCQSVHCMCCCLRRSCKIAWTMLAAIAVLLGIIALTGPLVVEMVDPEDVLFDQLVSKELRQVLGVPSDTEPSDMCGAEWQTLNDGTARAPDSGFVLRPGLKLRYQGFRKHHPVVFVPGIVSTGLELWEGKPCMKNHFRERLWGDSVMLRKLMLNKQCWLEHIMLNHTTGLDPDGIRLRAASGIRAADYFMGYYSLWSMLVQNLADLGYDERSMYMASYDWRLGPHSLEVRDRAWTRLRDAVEQLYEINDGAKVVVVCHSLGTNMFLYFLQWVERQNILHNVSTSWTDKYIGNIVNIAGPLLGVPKAVASLVSGETRDSAELGNMMGAVKEQLLPRRDIRSMFRSFGSVPMMLPIGGDDVWGHTSPDSIHNRDKQKQSLRLVPKKAEAQRLKDLRTTEIGASAEGIIASVLANESAADQHHNQGYLGHMMVLHHRLYNASNGYHGSALLVDARKRAEAAADVAANAAQRIAAKFQAFFSDAEASVPSEKIGANLQTSVDMMADASIVTQDALCRQNSSEHRCSGSAQMYEDIAADFVVPDTSVDIMRVLTANSSKVCKDDSQARCNEFSKEDSTVLSGELVGLIHADEAQSEWNSSNANIFDHDQLGEIVSSTYRISPALSRTFLSMEDVLEMMRTQTPEFMNKLESFQNLTATRPLKWSELFDGKSSDYCQQVHSDADTKTNITSLQCPLDKDLREETDNSLFVPAGVSPHQYWSNPLSAALPAAPNLSIFCLYGVGSQSERAYHYESVWAPESTQWEDLDDDLIAGTYAGIHPTSNMSFEHSTEHWRQMPIRIATDVENADAGVIAGVQRSEGDVTVPLLSLGYMCAEGWKSKARNPSNSRIVAREFRQGGIPNHQTADDNQEGHFEEIQKCKIEDQPSAKLANNCQHPRVSPSPSPLGKAHLNAPKRLNEATEQKSIISALKDVADALRSSGLFRAGLDWMRGSDSNDHVDILLNVGVLEDVLRVVAGAGDELEDRILSDVRELSKKVRTGV